MTWNNPKKDWKAGDTPNSGDFNRIEENIDILGRLDRTSAYGVAIGTNSYAVTLDPAPLTYYEGMCIAIKMGNQNTGASTINVNGLGAKSIRKANGNAVNPGNLKKDSVYTLRYNGVNFILQGEGGEGTALPGDVLTGKTFTNDNDTLTGTMPNRGAYSASIVTKGGSITIPSGYHNGLGKITENTNFKLLGTLTNFGSMIAVDGSKVFTKALSGITKIMAVVCVCGIKLSSNTYPDLQVTTYNNENSGILQDLRLQDGSVDRSTWVEKISDTSVYVEFWTSTAVIILDPTVYVFGY